MPPHKTRAAVSVDDIAIDFTAVAGAAPKAAMSNVSSGPSAAASDAASAASDVTRLLRVGGSDSGAVAAPVETTLLRAFDPSLQSYTQQRSWVAAEPASPGGEGRGGAGDAPPAVYVSGHRRRRTAFGGIHHTAPPVSKRAREEADAGTAASEVQGPVGSPSSGATGADWAAVRAAQTVAATALLRESGTGGSSAAEHIATRARKYQQELRTYCQQGLPWSDAAPAASSGAPPTAGAAVRPPLSLLCELFADGVPDVEPWDRWAFTLPRYDENALVVRAADPDSVRDVLDLVHHPVLPRSDYTVRYQHARDALPVEVKRYRTKDELKAERRKRLKQKQEEKRRAAAAAAKDGLTLASSSDGGALVVGAAAAQPHDRLSSRNLTLNLLGRSVLNPIGADTAVLDQYEQRFLDHQRRNFDRHMAALPGQVIKRERDVARHAAERPVLRAYRVYPMYTQAHLGKLRNFANDNQLRGFVLWIGECDAVIVLAGGEVAARHLDRWILHKMKWESQETRAVRLCSVPLQDAESFSFWLKRLRTAPAATKDRQESARGEAERQGVDSPQKEAVFLKHCATVADGDAFLREMPVDSPWADLSAVWRAAFLRDGLSRAP